MTAVQPLQEQIRHLKAENKKLHLLLKDSERQFTEKLQATQKESEKLQKMVEKVWPQVESKGTDKRIQELEREVLKMRAELDRER